jgi:uncharacterized damage-inducible protein DinB
MEMNELLADLFGRTTEHVHEAVDGLDAEALAAEPTPGTNTIGWLIWHLTRVQDHHFSELESTDQVWVSGDWGKRFGVDPDPDNTGYGHSAEQMASIKPDSAAALIDYYDAVYARTQTMLQGMTAADLDRVVDERWDPPVTLGVRLISVADDCIQHSGQASYARGIIDRS